MSMFYQLEVYSNMMKPIELKCLSNKAFFLMKTLIMKARKRTKLLTMYEDFLVMLSTGDKGMILCS